MRENNTVPLGVFFVVHDHVLNVLYALDCTRVAKKNVGETAAG